MMAQGERLKAELVCVSSKSGKCARDPKGSAYFGKHFQNPYYLAQTSLFQRFL